MERQKHGFEYEAHIIEKYNLLASTGYTDKFDAYYAFDTGSIPVQIKCIKWGSEVDLADYRRCATTTVDFILIVGFYEDSYSISNILREIIVYVDANRWRSLFSFNESPQMYAEMALVSNKHSDDARWDQFMATWHHKYITSYQPEATVGAICPLRIAKLRFKRDHKDQKRIQCAIGFKNFILYAEKLFQKWEFTQMDAKNTNLGIARESKNWKFVDRRSADIILASNLCELNGAATAIDPLGGVFCIKVLGLNVRMFHLEAINANLNTLVGDSIALETSLDQISEIVYGKMLLEKVSLRGAIEALEYKLDKYPNNGDFIRGVLARLR